MALTLDDIVPGPQFGSRHERRIAAPPAAVREWALIGAGSRAIRRGLLRAVARRATAR